VFQGARWGYLRVSDHARCAYARSDRWLRLEHHTLATSAGRDSWLWIAMLDQVSVLVHESATNKFVLFNQ
jgi:hypothetical protein